MTPRALAAQVLASVLQGQSLSAVLPPAVARCESNQHALLKDLCFGSLRYYPKIELYLRALLAKPLRSKDIEVHALLAIGLYQLVYHRNADHAIVNETVAATKYLKRPWAKAVVNAVMRNFLRQRETLDAKLATHPTFSSAHPAWLLKALGHVSQDVPLEDLVNANNARGPMTLRVNTLHGSVADYLARLNLAGIVASTTSHSLQGIQLHEPVDVNQLPGFAQGDCSVQDEAAQLAANLLLLNKGHRVLDACSAPGGKTAHMREMQPDIGSLVALDNDARRLSRVRDTLTRLGIDVDLRLADAALLEDWWDGNLFDRILLDAPCSATGVIRRHPDIKLLRKPEDIDKLALAQSRLIKNLWPALKEGGILLYATCSVLPRENDEVIEGFLNDHENGLVHRIEADWGSETRFGRQLLPTVNAQDGFYYARLQKGPL